jgi:hypothetical protein
VQAVTWISATDPLALVAIQAGQINTPSSETGADGGRKLDTQQRAVELGEPVPIVFARRRNDKGGVLISPGATEARFENDTSNAVTAYYHLVLSEGQIDSIPVKDVFQRACRVGSHTQTYNRRAGTWEPGNFIVQRSGYDLPECPYYCGSVGSYPDISTLSFQVTIPDGFDQWNRQIHLFIRGGLRVTRLVDSATGPSDNFADLVKWMLTSTNKVPAALIDNTALTSAATFLEVNNFTCNCWITESQNYADLLARWAPYFLLGESSVAGKRGLRPLLPVNNDGTIKTTAITPEYTFDEATILPGSLEIEYTSLADRQPFVAQMTWRQQLDDDAGIIRTAEVKYTGTAINGPYESHDLSDFCTNENHAVKVGAYILAKRVYTKHTLRFTAKPESHNVSLTPGSIIRVNLKRNATSASNTTFNDLHQVQRITKTLAGDITYECTHFPIDDQSRSLISLDVANAVGSGIELTSNKTGVSCDINSSTDNTIPSEAFTEIAYNPDFAELDAKYVGSDFGGSGFGQGSEEETIPFDIFPIGSGPVEGAQLRSEDPFAPGCLNRVQWFYSDAPGGSFVEFNNYGAQLNAAGNYITGSLEITAEGGKTIRAIYYSDCGDAPVIYQTTLEDGTLETAGSFYTGFYYRNGVQWGGWTSYAEPAWVQVETVFGQATYRLYVRNIGGSAGFIDSWQVATATMTTTTSTLRASNNSIIVDYRL